VSEAVAARKNFLESYPGLKRVKEDLIPEDAARGYFIGFDGRIVLCDSDHLMLAGYLQNGENLVMKYATRLWYQEMKRLGIPFLYTNFVHDENIWQVPDREGYAEESGKLMADCIVRAGENFGLNCPMAGNFKIGMNWLETH
jgi:DNA polymerase I